MSRISSLLLCILGSFLVFPAVSIALGPTHFPPGSMISSVGQKGTSAHTAAKRDFSAESLAPAWATQSSGVSVYLYSVEAVNGNVVWACGDKGTILRTLDGGTTWSQTSPVVSSLGWYNVEALDANTAWVIGLNSSLPISVLFKTTNGGSTWTQQLTSSDPTTFYDAVRFYDVNNGILLGDPEGGYFVIYTTTNGGNSWSRIPSVNIPTPVAGEYGLTNNLAVSGNNAWFSTVNTLGGNPRVFRSTDRGKTWQISTSVIGLGNELSSIAFASEGVGLVQGINGRMIRTTNGGVTWSSTITTGAFAGGSVGFATPTAAVFLGSGGQSGLSLDAGLTWSARTTPDTTSMYRMSFCSSTDGWAVGYRGTIWRWVGGVLPGPPWVTATSIANITATSATLLAIVTPNSSTTSAQFEWGTTTAVSNTTAMQTLGTGSNPTLASASLSGLTPNTTYFVRATAQNSNGVTKGSMMSFTTLPLAGDPYEPNNTSSKATSIAYSFKSSGAEIGLTGDVDYYKFNAATGDFVSIELVTDATSLLDARVSLFDQAGTELASSDIVSTGTERILFGINRAQSYYIRVVDAADTASFPNGVGSTSPGKSRPFAKISADAQSKRSTLQTGPYTLTLTLGAPLPPQILTAGSGFDGMVPLRWIPPQSNPPVEYRIYRGTTSTGPFNLIGSTSYAEDFLDLTASSGVPYFYTVKSVYGASNAESQGSNIDKATPRANGYKLTSKFAFIKPTIDGKLHQGEWFDAQVQDIAVKRTLNPSSPVTMYVKNDDQTFYLAVEDSNGNQSTYNRLVIGFDRDLNKTWDKTAPSTEGYLIIDDSAGVPIVRFFAVTGDYPSINSVDESRNPKWVTARFSYDPKSVQYEVAISFGRALPVSINPDGIGLYVAVFSDNLNAESPPGALLYAPLTYTEVPFSKAIVPRLPGEYASDVSSVLLLHLNEATGQFAIDATGNGNNGIASGTAITDGRFGKARNFNGLTDYILGSSSALDFVAQDFSIESWINTSSSASQSLVVATNSVTATGSNIALTVAGGASGGFIDLDINNGQGTSGSNLGGRKVNDGRWHHVAAVRSSSRISLYVDGVLDGQKSVTQNPNSSNAYLVGSNGAGAPFKGLIDELRISNKARSPNEFNLQLPPRNLTAAASAQTINLSWQNGGGSVALMRYRIYRGLDSTNVSLVDSTNSTAYTNSGLAAGTKFFYRVAAVDSTGFESARTGAAAATTASVAVPSLLSPADGAANQPTTATLSWSGSTGAISYHLQVSTNTGFTALSFNDSTIVATSAQVKSLLNGTTYYWRVSAKTAAGSSNYSAAWRFVTVIAAPQPPTLANPPNGSTGQPISLSLSWSAAASATLYRLQVDKSNTFTALAVDDSSITSTSRLVSSLVNNTTYYWRVSAKNAGGWSAFSATFSFVTIVGVPNTPTLSAPSNNASGVSSTVMLAWGSVVGATTYHVQLSTNSGYTPPLVLEDSTVTSNSRQLSGLAGNTTYYWRVRSKNAGGSSAWTSSSVFATVGTKAVTSPGVSFPSNPTASTDYRLVSFPGTSAFTVGQVLSGAQNTDWRIFRDNGAAEPNNLTEFSSSSSLNPGEGYWLLTKGTFNFSNAVTMPQLSSDGFATISVRNGWNIIGNPFDVPVSWSSVKADNSSSATLWSYTGTGGYQASSTLEPFKGYYFSSSSATLKIRYPFPSMSIAPAPSPAIDWQLQVALETEGTLDAENYVGTAPMARESLDELDQRKPPRFMDQASLSFSLAAPNGELQYLSSDFRPTTYEGQVWSFSVSNPKSAKGTIRINGIENVPAGFDLVLIDVQNTVPIDLRAKSEVPFQGPGERQAFHLIVGKKDFVQAKEAQLVPKEFELSHNYPNPFNPSTTITYKVPREAIVQLEIVSLLGQQLETLARGTHTPGTYSVTWNPTDRTASSGVYFARLLVDGKTVKTQKMTLVK